MDKMPCLPVKITAKQWADKLQEGSVFMRSLYDFGSWSAIERSKKEKDPIKSGVQGDPGEGIVRTVDPKVGDDFFRLLPDDLREVMKGAFYIDQERYQFYKIYCMYGLTYMWPERRFEQPDQRLREFGDTAVIFYNPDEFLNRVFIALRRQFGDNTNFKLDEVHYYPSDYYGDLDEFCKSADFAWQNELRMRVALLDPTETRLDDSGQIRKRLIQSRDSITLDVGDLKDISVQISVEDLIALRLPPQITPPAGPGADFGPGEPDDFVSSENV